MNSNWTWVSRSKEIGKLRMKAVRFCRATYRKGILLIFRNQDVDLDGNISKPDDGGERSGQSCLF